MILFHCKPEFVHVVGGPDRRDDAGHGWSRLSSSIAAVFICVLLSLSSPLGRGFFPNVPCPAGHIRNMFYIVLSVHSSSVGHAFTYI